MLHYLRAAARGLTYPVRAARRRPFIALAVIVLLLAAAAAAGLWYTWRQWELAQTALAEDRPAEARSRLAVCLFVWPRSLEVQLAAARAARISGDLPAAEAHLNRCLKLHGGATEGVQLEFLLLRVQTGEADKVAAQLFEAVDKGHPEAPIILETLAGAYIHRLRYKPAYYCLTRWIERRPSDAKPYQLRGWVLERMGHYKPAADDYGQALKLDPDLFPVRLRVAEMLLEDKQAPEALPHIEQLARQAPDRPEVLARMGMCRFLQGRTDEARRLMEAAVVHLPNDAALLIYLAKLDIQDGRGAQAEGRLRAVLRVDPSDTEALYNLASALTLQRRTSEAAAAMNDYQLYKTRVDRVNKLLKEVVDSPSAKADDYAEIGALLLSIRRERLGLYWLDQALEREPGHAQTHAALADHYEKKGDRDKAAVHRRSLREPNDKK